MRGKDLLEKLELADDKYITESAEYKKKDKKTIWKITAAAAALALVVAAIPITQMIMKRGATHGGAEYTPPLFKAPVYTAAQIGAIFDDQKLDSAATNAYVKTEVPSENELKYSCAAVPDGENVGVFEIKTPKTEASEAGLKAFGEKHLSSVSKALGINKPDYEIKKHEYPWEEDRVSYSADIWEGDYLLIFGESGYLDSFSFTKNLTSNDQKLVFDGVDVTVDQSKTDEEMITSLQPLKEKLCAVFGTDLPDTYIERRYDSYNEYGCSDLTVYFYNAEKNKVDFNICKCFDYIEIRFANSKNYSGAIVSKTVLTRANVVYSHYRCAPEEICVQTGFARRITIDEAEALLYNGYVFGGHACPLCMAAQEKITFDNYDKVGFLYIKGVPFYAFFKDLGYKNSNGTITYARTLVPAVEVSGYEEYFESQKAYHRNYPPDAVVE